MFFKIKILYCWIRIKVQGNLQTKESIAALQQKKLKKFAQKTLLKSTFYKPYFNEGHIQWSKVPQITKIEFMDSFDAINTCGIKRQEAMELALMSETNRIFNNEINGITIGLSTGTSGKRGLFLVSENERAQWVALVMTRVIEPKIFAKQKIAFFLRSNSNLYTSVASNFFEFKYFDIFKPLDQLLKELDAFSPNILAAQPSLLVDISEAQLKKVINIRLNQIISFAEVLYENDKAFIEEQLNAKITEVYQCTEGFLGVTCAYGTMHINEDLVLVEKEWIDAETFFPIITDFSRHAQPVVKYKLNDVLQIKSFQCPCGSPLMAIHKIIGRSDDILIFNNKKIYPDLLVRRIAIANNHFQNYTITQTNDKHLDIAIACKNEDFEMIKKSFSLSIQQLLSEFGIYNVELNFYQQTVRISGNKLRKIKRNYEYQN